MDKDKFDMDLEHPPSTTFAIFIPQKGPPPHLLLANVHPIIIQKVSPISFLSFLSISFYSLWSFPPKFNIYSYQSYYSSWTNSHSNEAKSAEGNKMTEFGPSKKEERDIFDRREEALPYPFICALYSRAKQKMNVWEGDGIDDQLKETKFDIFGSSKMVS